MKRARLSALARLVLVAGATVGAAPGQTPEQFVRRLYRHYGETGRPDPLGVGASRIFAPGLLRLIREDGQRAGHGVGLLDADPLCDCQDDGGFRLLQLDTIWTGSAHATVTVHMRLSNTPVTVQLDLDRAGHGWLIADVHNASTPSLLAFLGTALSR